MRATSDVVRADLRYGPGNHPVVHSGTEPVRVCFLIDELATAGTEMQLVALIRNLDRSRVTPYLCLLRGDNALSRRLEPSDCPVLRLGVQSFKRPSAVRAAMKFMAFLRAEEIDILQVYFPDSTYFGIPLAWLAGVRCRVRTRNNLGHWLTPTHRVLGRILNGLTTHTITNCAAARAALLADEQPDADRVFVLENGVDVQRFLRINPVNRKPPGAPRLVGAVANLRAVKGLELLIDAARRLLPTHPELRFRVAGEGEHRPELEHLVRVHGLADRFDLSGRVADIPAFLSELDVAVLCSRAEGLPNAVLEYMAAARPIVATEVGAVTDLLTDGVHGLLVPPGDGAALAAAIARVLQAPELARSLGEAARERVMRHYSRQAMVRRFEDFYLEMMRPHSNEIAPRQTGEAEARHPCQTQP
jgi:glycosyltransferase involved in cell wall biosynthesis